MVSWPEEQKRCPVHNCYYNLSHIWMSCSVAQEVWAEMRAICNYLSDTPWVAPSSINLVVALLAVTPKLKPIEQRRWHILYQLAVWCLWKSYLSVAWQHPIVSWKPFVGAAYYRRMVRSWILTDRTVCTRERYRSKGYNPTAFEQLWGENPKCVSIRSV